MRTLATAFTLALLSSPALAAGTIEGTVTAAKPCPAPPPHPVVKDAGVCGKDAPNEAVLVDKKGHLRNVVVFISDAKFEGKLTPVANAALDQRQCRYFPHVQAVTVGTPLSLMNNDAILHNVHANDMGMTVFNVAMPIKGQKLPIPMRKPGLMKLQCDAGHTWMNGWIYVFAHPYFAVTDDGGAFTIKDVPPGDYTVELWHEPADGQGAGVRSTAKVKVADGAPSKLELSLKL
jgi:plastocyanin